MFDISFTEILVIAAVALVVIGPERLPKVARTLGHLFGRAQRYVNDVKNDIQREMELEELKKWKTSVEGAARSIENTVRTEINQFQEAMEGEMESSIPAPSASSSGAATEAVPPPDSPHDSSATQTRSPAAPVPSPASSLDISRTEARRD
ncbi:sec-independent protein translocase protein TatB [Nitrosospira briensis]|uniref:Sec-independent protein translocase protein TatB n=1 Tax=Nitrosospira briensis TaxID=35799 RepID=A0A1I4XBH6_9PROT|nr:Sec-independent protein translocase protein TatB [Nitrosospira briensis]SFN22866.1 sec-independent protein translocase protein TatB [Nitrosospira briensis]